MPETAVQIPAGASSSAERHHYVPLLLDRSGERRALDHCDSATRSSMTPLIAVARHGDHPTRDALRRRAAELRAVIGERPFYLDLAGIDPCRRIATPQGGRETIAVLHEEAARRELAFIPVARSIDRRRRIELVRRAAAEHGRGLALRHRFGSRLRRTGEGPADRLLRTVESLLVTPAEVDLLLDLGWLDPDSTPSAGWIARQIQAIAARGQWRRVILAATCVPESMSKIAELDAAGAIARREWELWQEVAAATDGEVLFADYGVQHPNPPRSGGRTFGNLRYTTATELLVSRGHLITNMDDADFSDMCRRVVRSGSFSGADFSWGDAQIYRVAELRRSPRTAIFDDYDDERIEGINSHPFWRAVATSHHLKFVSVQLAEQRATAR